MIPARRHQPILEPTTSAAPLLTPGVPVEVGTSTDPASITLQGYSWQPADAFPGVSIRVRLTGDAATLFPSDHAFTAVTAGGVVQRPFHAGLAGPRDDLTLTMDFTIDATGALIGVRDDGDQVRARILIPAT